jgi:hypothetical protein
LQREHSMARLKHLGYELLEMADFFLHLHQSSFQIGKSQSVALH